MIERVQRGRIGGDGASQLLHRPIGYGPAMDLLMLGEPVNAAETLCLGLLDEVAATRAVEARMTFENEMNTLCFGAGGHLEGVNAFLGRRGAGFRR